ncbi:MAG: ATP-binding cassette domain-containing protein [Flavobacteriales bacterium AspAUS03]
MQCFFDMAPVDRVRLLGVNGSGKSTLIKILTGCTKPSEGRLKPHGYDVVACGMDLKCSTLPT